MVRGVWRRISFTGRLLLRLHRVGKSLRDLRGDPVTSSPGFRQGLQGSSGLGDANSSGDLNLSAATFIFGRLFLGDEAPNCREAADANNDGLIDISDGIAVLGHLFLGRGPPPSAGPPARAVRLRFTRARVVGRSRLQQLPDLRPVASL